MYSGHAVEVLSSLQPGSVHCVVTSPPYWGLRDYGGDPVSWADGWKGCLGLELTPRQYVDHLVEVFEAVARVLRQDGTLWLNLGDGYVGGGRGGDPAQPSGLSGGTASQEASWIDRSRAAPPGLKRKHLVGIPWHVAFALQSSGWYLRQDIVWHKPNPMPESVKDRCTRAHEFLFLFAHPQSDGRYFYDAHAIEEPAVSASQGRGSGNKQRKLAGTANNDRTNTHLGSSVPWKAETRNRRDVWTIPAKPFRGVQGVQSDHFAVMPPDLVRPCILAGTSERGVCSVCGAPWRRTTRRREVETTSACIGGDPDRRDGGSRERDPTGRGGNQLAKTTEPEGWVPSCSCDAPVVPAVVLDPFGGAGTVNLVADDLGRHSIYIDCKPEYTHLATQRIFGSIDPESKP